MENAHKVRPRIRTKSATVVLGLILIALALQLALFSLSNVNSLPASLAGLQIVDPFQAASDGSDELQQQLTNAQSQLEFMVWEKERASVIQDLEAYLQRRLNQEPFNYRLWFSLLSTSDVANYSDKTRAWILERALTLNRWNPKEVGGLAADCFARYDAMIELIPRLCGDVIANLSRRYEPDFLSRFVGVPSHQIEQVLNQQRRKGD